MKSVATKQSHFSILVAALGGEGGGVLTDWIAEAARESGLQVQCTSIPGVAQRTGATTYYIEVAVDREDTVLALTPMPGMVDLVVASELVEAARAAQNGYVSPDRTTLVASTHRVYATSEKSAMGDGRFSSMRAMKAVTSLAKRPLLFDMEAAVRDSRSAISAVMLGGVAGSGVLPIRREVFELVIRQSGIAVNTNLAGFAAAFELASGARADGESASPTRPAGSGGRSGIQPLDALLARARAEFPVESHFFVEQGIRRLVDFQNLAYAELFLKRLRPFLDVSRGADAGPERKLLCETARHLALRMSFEDLIRVADLKTRRSRIERVRREVDAKSGEPVVIVEYFKPGLEELCGFLPPWISRSLLGWAERRGKLASFNIGVYLKTTNLSGFLLLWLVARMRGLRRFGLRHAEEQDNIKMWLSAVQQSAAISIPFGLQVAEMARLIKGYSGTYRHGLENFNRILRDTVQPAIQSRRDASAEVQAELAAALTHSGAEVRPAPVGNGAKPLVFMRNKGPSGGGTPQKADPPQTAPTAPFF
jgi:indolepyruvate ferredoxin oxidoreductase beta subunit